MPSTDGPTGRRPWQPRSGRVTKSMEQPPYHLRQIVIARCLPTNQSPRSYLCSLIKDTGEALSLHPRAC